MANETAEIKGSRREWVDRTREFIEYLYASTDGTTDIPTRGQTTAAGTPNITEKVCLGPEKQWEIIPGLCYVRCVFAKWIAYS